VVDEVGRLLYGPLSAFGYGGYGGLHGLLGDFAGYVGGSGGIEAVGVALGVALLYPLAYHLLQLGEDLASHCRALLW